MQTREVSWTHTFQQMVNNEYVKTGEDTEMYTIAFIMQHGEKVWSERICKDECPTITYDLFDNDGNKIEVKNASIPIEIFIPRDPVPDEEKMGKPNNQRLSLFLLSHLIITNIRVGS